MAKPKSVQQKPAQPAMERLRNYKNSKDINQVLAWAVFEASQINQSKESKNEEIEVGDEIIKEFFVESITFLQNEVVKPDVIKLASGTEYVKLQVAAEVYRLAQKKSNKGIANVLTDFDDSSKLFDSSLMAELRNLRANKEQYELAAREAEVAAIVKTALRESFSKEKPDKIEFSALRKAGTEKDIIALANILIPLGFDIENGRNPANGLVRALKNADPKELFTKSVTPRLDQECGVDIVSDTLSAIGSMKNGEYIGLNSFTGAELLFAASIARDEEEYVELVSRANESTSLVTDVGDPLIQLYADVRSGNVKVSQVEGISHAINSRRVLLSWNEGISKYVLDSLYNVLYIKKDEHSSEAIESHLTLAAHIADEFWADKLEDENGIDAVYAELNALYDRRLEEDSNGLPAIDEIFSIPIDNRSKAIALILVLGRYGDLTEEEKQRMTSSTYPLFFENANWDEDLQQVVDYETGISSAIQVSSNGEGSSPLLAVRSMVDRLIGGNIILHARSPLTRKENIGDISLGDIVLNWLESDEGRKFYESYPLSTGKSNSELGRIIRDIILELNSFTLAESIRINLDAFENLEEFKEQLKLGNIPALMEEKKLEVIQKNLDFLSQEMEKGLLPLTIIDALQLDFSNMTPDEIYILSKEVYGIENKWLRKISSSLGDRFDKYSLRFKFAPSLGDFLDSGQNFTREDLEELFLSIFNETRIDLRTASKETISGLMLSYNLMTRANVFGAHVGTIVPSKKHYDVFSNMLNVPYKSVASWSLAEVEAVAKQTLGTEWTKDVSEFVYKRLLYMQILMGTNQKNVFNEATTAIKYFILGDHQASIPIQQCIFEGALERKRFVHSFDVVGKIEQLQAVLEEFKVILESKKNSLPVEIKELHKVEEFIIGIKVASIVSSEANKEKDAIPIPAHLEKTIQWEFRRIFPGFSNKVVVLLAKSLASIPMTQSLLTLSRENTLKTIKAGTTAECAAVVDKTWGTFTSLAKMNIQVSANHKVSEQRSALDENLPQVVDTDLMEIASRIQLIIERLPSFVDEETFIQPIIDDFLRTSNVVVLAENALQIQKEITKGTLRGTLGKDRPFTSVQTAEEVYSTWMWLLRDLSVTTIKELRYVNNIDELEEVLLRQISEINSQIMEDAKLATEKLLTHPLLMSLEETRERFGEDLPNSLFATLMVGEYEVVNIFEGTAEDIKEKGKKPLIELLLPGVTVSHENGELNILAVNEAMSELDSKLNVTKAKLEKLVIEPAVTAQDADNSNEEVQKSLASQGNLRAKERRRLEKKRAMGMKKKRGPTF